MTWLGYALLSALFAGLVAVFGKLGVREVDSTLATTVRACIMALALIALVLVRRADFASLRYIALRSWAFLVLAGLAGAASWLCYFRALQIGDAARVAPIDRLSVLVAIAFGVLFLGEKLTASAALGGLLVIGGSILIARG
jgi:transporter family protein